MTYGNPSGEENILECMDFFIHRGERIALLGPSGCGKTTLLHILGGLLQPTEGTVLFCGVPLAAKGRDMARRRGQLFGFIFQRPLLFPELTAEENVAFPGKILGRRRSLFRARELLDSVGLAHRREAMPWELSGGEQQRVAIARALITGPKFLLADEPTGSLDSAAGERVWEQLFDLSHSHNTGLLLATHNPCLASHCDQIFRIRERKLEKMKEIYL
jgi:ABC-type lipoprotein export system ATPase subunit